MLHVKVLSICLIISSSVLESTKPDRQQSKQNVKKVVKAMFLTIYRGY